MLPPCCSVVDDRDFLNHEVIGINIKHGVKVFMLLIDSLCKERQKVWMLV